MPPDETAPGGPAQWLRHAQADLALARTDPPPDVLTELLCFHAQQAAEKAIKAVLLYRGMEIPYTHDIKRLLECLPEEEDLPQQVRRAAELTMYAVLTRYPADLSPITQDEYRRAIRMAEATLQWAQRRIQ